MPPDILSAPSTVVPPFVYVPEVNFKVPCEFTVTSSAFTFVVTVTVWKLLARPMVIAPPAEVGAIRWAVAEGARVISLSLGGVRDPLDPKLDTYSPLEEAAIEYAHSKGVVVVAAVGNGPQSPSTPWTFADYPAALPHVIGVSAVRQDRSVPAYSNRDAVYNDLAAPGDDMFSTIPTNLVASGAGCTEPYSDCGPIEFRNAIGTSFAAPQVSAAAALLLGLQPKLRPEQVSWLLERSAVDGTAHDVRPEDGFTKRTFRHAPTISEAPDPGQVPEHSIIRGRRFDVKELLR